MAEPHRALVLIAPHAEWVASGRKTLVVKKRKFGIAGEPLLLADSKHSYGVLVLGEPKTISLKEFEALQAKHGITDEERERWWPGTSEFWAYPVVSFKAHPEGPKPFTLPRGAQTFVELEKPFAGFKSFGACVERLKGHGYDEDAARRICGALRRDFEKAGERLPRDPIQATIALSAKLTEVLPAFVSSSMRFVSPQSGQASLLRGLPSLASALVEEYSRFAVEEGLEKPGPAETENPFDLAERLGAALRRARTRLPAKTKVAALTEDAITMLDALARLESEFRVAEDRPEIGKAAPPEGALPVLKMPDPAFLIARLRDGDPAGLLSRLPRKARVGLRQFLVNETAPEHAAQANGGEPSGVVSVWGVVTLSEPQELEDLTALPERLRAGLDKFTLAEFSTEKGPIYYVPIRLIAAYDPPIELKRAPRGRRFAETIRIEELRA